MRASPFSSFLRLQTYSCTITRSTTISLRTVTASREREAQGRADLAPQAARRPGGSYSRGWGWVGVRLRTVVDLHTYTVVRVYG